MAEFRVRTAIRSSERRRAGPKNSRDSGCLYLKLALNPDPSKIQRVRHPTSTSPLRLCPPAQQADGADNVRFISHIRRTSSFIISSQCSLITAKDVRTAPPIIRAEAWRNRGPKPRLERESSSQAMQKSIARAATRQRAGSIRSQKTFGNAPGTPMYPAASPRYSANEATMNPTERRMTRRRLCCAR